MGAQWQISGNDDITESSVLGSNVNNNFALNLITNGQRRMYVHGTSDNRTTIGIGTATPNYTLQLHSTVATPYYVAPPHGTIDPNPDNGTESMIQFTNQESGDAYNNGLRVGVRGDKCYFLCEDKLQMIIKNMNSTIALSAYGHISFFGGDPFLQSRLHLASSDENGFLITKTQGAGTFGLRVRTGGTDVNALEVMQTSTLKFVVKNDGRTGIGTDSPDAAYMLDVKGKIRGCEVRVNNANGWCDYVFAKDYALMPLAKLQDYINTNHHLPEMLSQEEVEKEGGFDLAKMNVALLKRSEENTLYILQLESELQSTQIDLQKKSEDLLSLEKRLTHLESIVAKELLLKK